MMIMKTQRITRMESLILLLIKFDRNLLAKKCDRNVVHVNTLFAPCISLHEKDLPFFRQKQPKAPKLLAELQREWVHFLFNNI